jgi:mono/diheme cytochrome c family protein
VPFSFVLLQSPAMKRVLAALLVLLIAAVLFVGFRYGWDTYPRLWRMAAGPRARKLRDVTFERTPARRARGEYLANGLLACSRCHSDRDWSQPGGPPVAGKEFAGHIFEDRSWLVAPNLTSDRETGAGSWTDDMLARAIREGVGHDGRALHPQMWYEAFSKLSDEDVASIVVYLRSLPPIHNALPRTELPWDRRFDVNSTPQPITTAVTDPDLAQPVKRGEQLEWQSDCAGCHTDWYHPGSEMNGKIFAGGNELWAPGGKTIFSPNITPDPSGISYYDEALFIRVMRTGKVGARPLHGVMPWYWYKNLSDEDLKGIFAWLRAQEPVKHTVDNTEPPTYCKRCRGTHGGGDRN